MACLQPTLASAIANMMADADLYHRLEMSLPAPWIDHTDRAYAWNARRLLSFAVDHYNDAVAACQLFEPITFNLQRNTSGHVSESEDEQFKNRLRGISARAYVYALDMTCTFVEDLRDQPLNTPPAIAACTTFLQRFQAALRLIRNSLAHVDARFQGVGYGV